MNCFIHKARDLFNKTQLPAFVIHTDAGYTVGLKTIPGDEVVGRYDRRGYHDLQLVTAFRSKYVKAAH
jgi:hypothetical protein